MKGKKQSQAAALERIAAMTSDELVDKDTAPNNKAAMPGFLPLAYEVIGRFPKTVIDWANSPIPREVAPDETVGWFDETMDASAWVSLPEIGPENAAMLLAGFNPNRRKDVHCWESHDALTDHHRKLANMCKEHGGKRPLVEWRDWAVNAGLKIHGWLDEYQAAGGDVMPASIKETQRPPMARAGLRKRYGARWATLESDLKNAGANGLREAAKVPKGWDETKAVEWAISKGKMDDPARSKSEPVKSSPLPSTVYKMGRPQ